MVRDGKLAELVLTNGGRLFIGPGVASVVVTDEEVPAAVLGAAV